MTRLGGIISMRVPMPLQGNFLKKIVNNNILINELVHRLLKIQFISKIGGRGVEVL
jgi:hypothetical protein